MLLIYIFILPFLAKTRGIAIPSDLDAEVNSLFSKSKIVLKSTKQWMTMGKIRKESSMSLNRDYKSIIEGLQVINDVKQFHLILHFLGAVSMKS